MYIYSSFAERYVLVQVVSRFRDLIGEDVIELKLIERSEFDWIALLFALDRTIFYSVPFKVPALNRVTGGGPYTLVRRDIVFKPSWSIDLSTVRTGFGVVGEKVDTLVTDGTLVRQSAPETFDAVTQELYPIPYMVSYRATATRSESISLGEGCQLQRYYWLFDHPVQLPPTPGFRSGLSISRYPQKLLRHHGTY
jgi:hypothetical protein